LFIVFGVLRPPSNSSRHSTELHTVVQSQVLGLNTNHVVTNYLTGFTNLYHNPENLNNLITLLTETASPDK